jgi:hypothetical protein
MNREAPMRSCLNLLPLLGALLASCSSPSPVDEVVASYLAARGGTERIQALSSIREIKRPGLVRLEFSTQSTTSVFANDGSIGWQVAPLQGVFEPQVVPPEADAAGGVDQRDIEGPLVNWREKGHVVELVGRETLPGGEAFKLKLTLKGGAIRYDYVDVVSHMLVRSDFTRIVRGHPVELQNTFSDFREVGGLVFPHHIETRAKERPDVIEVEIETIELDPELDDALFRLPG